MVNLWHQTFLWGDSCPAASEPLHKEKAFQFYLLRGSFVLQILIMTSKWVARPVEVNNIKTSRSQKNTDLCTYQGISVGTFNARLSFIGRQLTYHHAALSLSTASRIITTSSSSSCGVVVFIFTCWSSLTRFRLTVIIAHCHVLSSGALPYWHPSNVGNSD